VGWITKSSIILKPGIGKTNPRLRSLLKTSSGSVAEWLASWTQAQKDPGSNRSRDAVHTHRASVHQAAKLVAALLRVAGVTAGLVESNGSLPPGL